MWENSDQDSSASFGGYGGGRRGTYYKGVEVITEPMDASTFRKIRESQWTSLHPLTNEEIILRYVAWALESAAYDNRNIVSTSIQSAITYKIMEDGKMRETRIAVDLKWLAGEMEKRGYQTEICDNGPGFATKQSLWIRW